MWELRPLRGEYTVTAKYLTLFPSAYDLQQLLPPSTPLPTETSQLDDCALSQLLSKSYPEYSVAVETLKHRESGGEPGDKRIHMVNSSGEALTVKFHVKRSHY